MSDEWLSAAAARSRLGVRAQTLYAYVSRGRVRARPDPGDTRRSLYAAADLDALDARKRRGRRVADVAAGALAWGEPAIVSAISTVAQGRLIYRGQDAIELAETASFEQVAALLRGGGEAVGLALRPAPPVAPSALARAFVALAALAQDPPLAGRRESALAVEAQGLMDLICDALTAGSGEGGVAERLAAAWGPSTPPRVDLIRRTLVLLADHELNPSAFAARVAASTGASLAACALAGLATLSGPRHGGAPAALRQLLARAAQVGNRAAVTERLGEGGAPPGFGHPLYREHDPRAAALLRRFAVSPALQALADEVRDFAGLAPNVDFALVAVSDALRLPDEAPVVLFAMARSAGWIAHAIEQAQSGAVIRPRARYIGAASSQALSTDQAPGPAAARNRKAKQ